jgi:hypothetical protein
MWSVAMESRTSPSTKASSSAGGIGEPGASLGPGAAGAGAGAGFAAGTGERGDSASTAAADTLATAAEAGDASLTSGAWATPWVADKARPTLKITASADLSRCRIKELPGTGVVYAPRWR